MRKGLGCRSPNTSYGRVGSSATWTSAKTPEDLVALRAPVFLNFPLLFFKLCSPAQELEMHKLLMSPQHIPLCPGPTFCREKKQINGNCIFLIIFNCSIFHHPKLNCKANFHTKYQIKLQAVTNHMIYIKPYIWGRLEINTFPNLTSCVREEGPAGSRDTLEGPVSQTL